MRFFALLLSVFMLCFIFVGCTPLPVEIEEVVQPFEEVAVVQLSYENCLIYYRETLTDIMYICFNGHREAGLSVMLEPETGLPMTYSRYIEMSADGDN